jgi:hypothetical protein
VTEEPVQRKSKFVARFRIQDESVCSWGDLRSIIVFATFFVSWLGLPDPHPGPLVRGMDPDPSIIKQN